jgi:alpha-mannosidase
VFNAAPHVRDGVPALGASPVAIAGGATTITEADGGYVLDNGIVRVTIDARGLITSALDLELDREAVAPGLAANLLQIHPDTPNMWDAWDVDKFYRHKVTDLVDLDSLTREGDAIKVVRSFGSSKVTQTLTVPAGGKRVEVTTEVDWHETEKFLKAAFPLDVHAERSAAETQYGHVFRPTHVNTSWETAKFEICAHRYIHVEEPGFGVALVNDSTYGHDVGRTAGPDGRTTTTVRLSLLRAPRFPDPITDQGDHTLRYAMVIGADIIDAVADGYRINLPVRTVTGGNEIAPLVSVSNPNVVVASVKAADDGTGDIVVRVYEATGGRAKAVVTPSFATTGVTESDLLERPFGERELDQDGPVALSLRPFEIVTLRFAR